MRNIFVVLCLLASTTAFQATTATAAAPDITALTDAEKGSPDGVVNTFYQILSGDAGQRNWSKMRALCLPKAQFNTVRINSTGKRVNRFGSIDDYITNTNTFFRKNQYYKQETDRQIADFGEIATIFSNYTAEINYSESGRQIHEEGLITFQLVNAKGRWWISSVFWNTGKAPQVNTTTPSTTPTPQTTAPTTTPTTQTPAPSNDVTTTAPATQPNTYQADDRLPIDRTISFEAGVEGKIFNESEVDKPANFGQNDGSIFKYLSDNVKLPADDSGKGTYTVEFIVDKEGWCNNVKVYDSKSNLVVDEFIKAFSSMPKWTPAKMAGKDVNCRITLSLNLN